MRCRADKLSLDVMSSDVRSTYMYVDGQCSTGILLCLWPTPNHHHGVVRCTIDVLLWSLVVWHKTVANCNIFSPTASLQFNYSEVTIASNDKSAQFHYLVIVLAVMYDQSLQVINCSVRTIYISVWWRHCFRMRRCRPCQLSSPSDWWVWYRFTSFHISVQYCNWLAGDVILLGLPLLLGIAYPSQLLYELVCHSYCKHIMPMLGWWLDLKFYIGYL